jgi:hypothetical protein
MPYQAVPPTHESIQWDGGNVEDCHAFHLAWFNQPAPPPPPPMSQPDPPFRHDEEMDTLVTREGTLAVGDWLVNGGTWVEDGPWAGQPEIMTDADFQVKFTFVP